MKTNNSETGSQPKGSAESGSDAPTCSPSSLTPETDKLDRTKFDRDPNRKIYFTAYIDMMAHAKQMELERDDARRDRDEWKASAAQYHSANQWLDSERSRLFSAIRETILANLNLADGDVCTLKRLKDAIRFELPPENAEPIRSGGGETPSADQPPESP